MHAIRSPVAGEIPRSSPAFPLTLSSVDEWSTDLLRRYQLSKDDELFGELYRLNVARIQRIVSSCLRFGARDLDAEEIVEDVFVSVFGSARSFRPEPRGAFRRWSSQIARNAVRHALRVRRRRLQRFAPGVLLEPLAAPAEHRGDEWIREECEGIPLLLTALAASHDALAARDRSLLEARDALGEGYASVSRRLGVRAGAARMAVLRARRRLLEGVARRLRPPSAGASG